MYKQEKGQPIIKWVGGKRQLMNQLLERMPDKYGTYYEPFFGGGALFFEVCPKHAIINDFNSQLTNLYKQIRNNKDVVLSLLDQYQQTYNNKNKDEQNKYYAELRNKFNQNIENQIENTESAALFIFLNKAGFNGLYRVNSKGAFNVPSAHRHSLNLYSKENMTLVQKQLKKATIKTGDFEAACNHAKPGDFVFFDSPYYDTFDTYQAGGFSKADHERLAKLFKKLDEKGVYCMLTNSNTDFIKELYKDFKIEIVSVKRMVNCDASNRVGEEVIIRNYGK